MKYSPERCYVLFRRKNTKVKVPTSYYIDDISRSGVIKLKVRVESPFIPSSGDTEVENGKLIFKLLEFDKGRVMIPGSTFKGAFRTYFEVIFTQDYVNAVFGDGRISRLFFSDTVLENVSKERVVLYRQFSGRRGRNDEIRLYRCVTGCRKSLRQSALADAIKRGFEFDISINYFGLSPNDIVNVLSAVGMNPNMRFKILVGKGKDHGYGQLSFEILEIVDLNGNKLKLDWRSIDGKVVGALKEIASKTMCGGGSLDRR